MTNKQDKGFTLVELLIVIVILGILATITVFAVRGITNQGRDAACDTDQRTLQVAVESYFAQVGGATIPGADSAARLAALETEGFLAPGFTSANWDLSDTGVLTASATGDC
jgi:prepilin-type N-terminal cleavage/methylation domain-containing protein